MAETEQKSHNWVQCTEAMSKSKRCYESVQLSKWFTVVLLCIECWIVSDGVTGNKAYSLLLCKSIKLSISSIFPAIDYSIDYT